MSSKESPLRHIMASTVHNERDLGLLATNYTYIYPVLCMQKWMELLRTTAQSQQISVILSVPCVRCREARNYLAWHSKSSVFID